MITKEMQECVVFYFGHLILLYDIDKKILSKYDEEDEKMGFYLDKTTKKTIN